MTLDTGTPVTRLPASQVEAIAQTLGAVQDPNSPVGAYDVSCDYAGLSGGWTFTFSGPSGQLTIAVPWSEFILSAEQGCQLGIIPLPDGEGQYVAGDNLLRSIYLVYNYPAGYISMAQASADDSCTNCMQPLPS